MGTIDRLLNRIIKILGLERSNGNFNVFGSTINARDIVNGDVYHVWSPSRPAVASHQLPPPASDFVGRQAEVAKIEETLELGKPVGLFGMGGVGKSELARFAADRVRHR